MKKAIYLDERERDLARRVCRFVMEALDDHPLGDAARFACAWTRDEVQRLAKKFAEREVEEGENDGTL